MDYKKRLISIHALRGEGDQIEGALKKLRDNISIHALRGEGDAEWICWIKRNPRISIHALRGEGDLCMIVA